MITDVFSRPLRRKFLHGLVVFSLSAADLVLAQPREVALSETLPRLGDHTVLSWREGAPYVTNARPEDVRDAGYASDRRFLRLATGHFAADFDTEKIALTGLVRRPAPAGEAAVVAETLAAAPLPPSQLDLEIQIRDRVYRRTGREPLALTPRGQPVTPLAFPVRVIESGRFFQKFALHDLELHTADGHRLRADARLEVSAWPDRLALLLIVRPEETLASARMTLRLETGGRHHETGKAPVADWAARTEQRAVLVWAADAATTSIPDPDDIVVRIAPTDPRSQATVRWNAEEASTTIRLEAPPWPAPREGNDPESMLDAWESHAVTVENRSAAPQRVGLVFNHTPVKSIIGYVPMVLDTDGVPSGLPVQISKNWHVAKSSAPVPYMGQWMHGRQPPSVQA